MDEKAQSFKWNVKDPLGRAYNERRDPNKALNDYYLMGSDRSLRKLWERYRAADDAPTRRITTLKKWSAFYCWQDRITAQADIENAMRRQRRADRQAVIDDEDWDLGRQLRELALGILAEGPKYFKTRRRLIKGKSQTIMGVDGTPHEVAIEPDREIITVELNAQMAIRAAKLGSDIQRAAAGVGGRSATESWNIDLAELSIPQLTRLAAGEELIDVLLTPTGNGGTGTPQAT